MSRQRKIDTRNSKPEFWDQLDKDIDIIGQRAKDNLRKYEHYKYENIKPKTASHFQAQMNRTFNDSRQEKLSKIILSQESRQEQQRGRLMKNRLAFLSDERHRRSKTIELAKRKYEHICSVRNQTIHEKQQMKKRRQSMMNEEKRQKKQQVKEVKTARDTRNLSMINWKKTIGDLAMRRRQESQTNQRLIQREKLSAVAVNKQKALKTKQSLENSRSIISEISEKKITKNRINQRKQLSDKLKVLNSQKKNNEKLFEKLRSQSERISKWKSRAHREIEEYKSFLGIDPRKKERRSVENASKSFYITNV